MQIKKNISLIVGIAIPVVMVLFVAGLIYLPGKFIEPEYDFIYAIHDGLPSPSGVYGKEYYVVDGKIEERDIPVPLRDDNFEPKQPVENRETLYYFDVKNNTKRELTLSEAQEFIVLRDTVSPDGFEIVPASRNGDFPFFFGGRDYGTYYIQSGSTSKKLNINLAQNYYYYDSFMFLGWVEK